MKRTSIVFFVVVIGLLFQPVQAITKQPSGDESGIPEVPEPRPPSQVRPVLERDFLDGRDLENDVVFATEMLKVMSPTRRNSLRVKEV